MTHNPNKETVYEPLCEADVEGLRVLARAENGCHLTQDWLGGIIATIDSLRDQLKEKTQQAAEHCCEGQKRTYCRRSVDSSTPAATSPEQERCAVCGGGCDHSDCRCCSASIESPEAQINGAAAPEAQESRDATLATVAAVASEHTTSSSLAGLSLVGTLLDSEADWHALNRGSSGKGATWESGFTAALRHARRLVDALEDAAPEAFVERTTEPQTWDVTKHCMFNFPQDCKSLTCPEHGQRNASTCSS